MPKVGARTFPYTKAGMLAARVYAKRTGQRLQMHSTKTRTKRKTR